MFFSRVILFAISLGALSVLATPHALHHHALHRRALAARVASAHTNESAVTAKRQSSPKCKHAPSSSIALPSAIVALPNTVPPPRTTPKPSPSKSSPTSTSQQQQPPATTPTPTQPSGSSAPGTGGGTVNGEGTFYSTGLGACGDTNSDSDFIVAVSKIRFDNFPGYDGKNPNSNPICHKKVIITGPTGATQTATIVDRCEACAVGDLDMSPKLFDIFSPAAAGRIHITWNFL